MSLEGKRGIRSEQGGADIEKEPGPLLFEVTLMRHAEPKYLDEGHDLTPRGIEQARAVGRMMKETGYFDFEKEEVVLVHSPTVRAVGTIDFVAEAAGLPASTFYETEQLRKSDFKTPDARKVILASFKELEKAEGLEEHEAAAKHHYTDPMHEEGELIETSAHRRQRLYRVLDHLARVSRTEAREGRKIPHVLAVAHFELITHILNDVFGIENLGAYNKPSFAELVRIQAFEESPTLLRLRVSYNGEEKEVLFDRTALAGIDRTYFTE